jgi:dienelactone hydrolase
MTNRKWILCVLFTGLGYLVAVSHASSQPLDWPITATPGRLDSARGAIRAGSLDRFIQPFAPLKFSSEVKRLGMFSNLSNAVFKPAGNGPFPAVVVVHSCGGVTTPQIRDRAKELLEAGYLILMLDSFGPRGQTSCRNDVVQLPLVVRDTVDALAHLHTLKEVDTTRIFLVGYSMGSFTAAVLASESYHWYFNSKHRFKALVGWYGSCGSQWTSSSRVTHYVRADTSQPLLLLMAEGDRESPITPYCFPLLDELKATGAPVEWHIYAPPVTHAWDHPGYTMTTGWGEYVVNRHDAKATEDATRRTLEFLKRHQ